MKTTVLILLAAMLFSCQQDIQEETQSSNTSYELVDKSLWPYFTAFENEAKQRGIKYDLNELEISGMITDINQGNVAGICSFNSIQPNHVDIDRVFWNRSSHLLKEMIVFHELGHCVIFRDHYEASHSNGSCVSIMRSGLEDCQDNYSIQNRADYLDELFFNKVNIFN